MQQNSMWKHPHVKAMMTALWVSALLTVASRLFLRFFHCFLLFDAQFYAIFAQIKGASMASPVILLFFLSTVWFIATAKLRGQGRIVLHALMTVILLCLAIWRTDVNGIRFGDVIRSLIPLLKGGAI